MYFVYILQSMNYPHKRYVGCTQDLKGRLGHHNSKNSPYTARYVPWKLVSYIAIEDKVKAYEFEKYLKSGSGRVFVLKRLM